MGEKGMQLNKCLCKAHVCGVVMVTVLLISEVDNEPKCLQSYEAGMMKWYDQNCCNGVALLCVCFTTNFCLCFLQTKCRALLVQETIGWSHFM